MKNSKTLKERFEAWRAQRNIKPTTEAEKEIARANAKKAATKVLEKISAAKKEEQQATMAEKLAALKEARREKLAAKMEGQTVEERREEVIAKVKSGREKLMQRIKTMKHRAEASKAGTQSTEEPRQQFHKPTSSLSKDELETRRAEYKKKLEAIREKVMERRNQKPQQ